MISLYYFVKRKFEEGLKPEFLYLADIPLLDYVKLRMKEILSFVLEGVALEDLAFVGLLEYLDEDLRRLVKQMDWKKIKMPKVNDKTAYRSKYPEPSIEEYLEIQELLKDDIKLFEHALSLRKYRM